MYTTTSLRNRTAETLILSSRLIIKERHQLAAPVKLVSL